MTKWEKFLVAVFSLNILLGIIAFGYFLSFFTGMHLAIFITILVYVPFVTLGIEPSTRKVYRTPWGEYIYPKDDE